MDPLTTIRRETHIPTADEMRAAGLEAALTESLQLINLNCAQGFVHLYRYPDIVNHYISQTLAAAGYEVIGETGSLTVRWDSPSSGLVK
jgi:hypothetical protein